MGAITILALTMGMVVSLGQFQEVPAAEWVKVAAAIAEQFKFENVSARVVFRGDAPSAMKISYITKPNADFDSSAQNVEMENVAKFAVGGVNWSHYLIADGGRVLDPLDSLIAQGTRSMYDASRR